jgi:hypothetical protein
MRDLHSDPTNSLLHPTAPQDDLDEDAIYKIHITACDRARHCLSRSPCFEVILLITFLDGLALSVAAPFKAHARAAMGELRWEFGIPVINKPPRSPGSSSGPGYSKDQN